MHRCAAVLLSAMLLLARGGSAAPIVAAAPPPKVIIISQPGSPIEITQYTAAYQEGGSYTREGIRHNIAYRNRGTQKVVAIEFGIVSFSVFNQFLGKTGGIEMDDVAPGASGKGAWVQSPYADFSFLTGVVYVSAVRLEDGTIWNADNTTVLTELRKIEKDFDAKQLKEQPTPRGGAQ